MDLSLSMLFAVVNNLNCGDEQVMMMSCYVGQVTWPMPICIYYACHILALCISSFTKDTVKKANKTK